jgi:chemotaxis protein methyltransferase WspC
VKRIESLLSREIGLSPRSIGSSAIEAAVRTRLRACGAADVTSYLTILERDSAERTALIEEIVVSETWFFRDEDVFKALRRHATGWLARDRALRVLSLPCATGEEAYSVAITLLEAGLRESRFSVRGVDVSERALAHARRAVYGKNSFRGAEAAQQRGYFETSEAGARVIEQVRDAVTFARGNVLDAASFSLRAFDVILCRNLLIYLDPQARARALDNLFNWLSDDGLLFAGHAEAIEQMDARFQRLAETAQFAYVKQRRGERSETARAPTGPRPAFASTARATGRAASHNKRAIEAKTVVTGGGPTPGAGAASLERATELANRGRLDEAQRLCERVIAETRASPEAYCLLGVIHNAAGQRASALDCFNKALYLNQDHYETLVHLALLYEQRGELPAAVNFRRRAERARRGDGK